jgi:hypothetical protein
VRHIKLASKLLIGIDVNGSAAVLPLHFFLGTADLDIRVDGVHAGLEAEFFA